MLQGSCVFRDRVGSSVAGGGTTDITQRGRASCSFWPQRGYLLLDGRRVCSFIWLARDSRKSLDSRNFSPLRGADKFESLNFGVLDSQNNGCLFTNKFFDFV
jgi:hypothetical protein